MTKKIKGLVLFSGGLDSVLALKILEKQGIEMAGIFFSSSFFGAKKAKDIARANKIKLFVKNFNEDILNLVKNPAHGLGKNMNPCIDCHAKMFQRAQEFAEKKGYDFLASGEVLGQRPFSQNKQALLEVAKTAGEEILRPLSAKLLAETSLEKEGLINRKKLLDIQGRQRNRQIELAKKFGINKFETPAGGCLLTDPEFSKRLEKALNEFSGINCVDVELLKWGRVYWTELKNQKNPILVIIGRHKEDNDNLESLFLEEKDLLIKPKDIKGPNILVRFFDKKINLNEKEIEIEVSEEKPDSLDGKIFENEIEMLDEIAKLAGWYIKKARKTKIAFLTS